MAIKPLFRGSAVALITPLKNGTVDYETLEKLVEFQISNGTAAIIACGTTGEPATLTPDERERVITTIVAKTAGRVPVICGTGSNCTQTVIDTEKRYRSLGCAAQLVVTPYYNKTTQEGLYAHFMAVAQQTELPIVIYNVPSRTGLDIAPETLRRLCETDRFIAIKESSYNVPSIMEKVAAVGDRLSFYSGNDDQVYPLLALGGAGVISVVANLLPDRMADMTNSWLAGDHQGALQKQLELMPISKALFCEVNPIPVKYGAELMGLCAGEMRLPLVKASLNAQQQVERALKGLGVLA